jgi:hypothetical protein
MFIACLIRAPVRSAMFLHDSRPDGKTRRAGCAARCRHSTFYHLT